MEKYNLENLISTLFVLGYDQLDSIFLTLITGKIYTEKGNQFEYEEKEFTKEFKKFVNFDGFVYKLKEGLTLKSNTKLFKDKTYTIKDLFTSGVVNKKLSDYLINFDFRDIIIRKISLIGPNKIDKLACLFSNKEKSIIYEMFGIEDIEKKELDKSMSAYRRIYNQESIDIDNTIKALSKLKLK